MAESNRDQYQSVSIGPFTGGLNDGRADVLLAPDESPNCENLDFDRSSLASVKGAAKFGNRPAPQAGVLTQVDSARSPLSVAPYISVPVRGYVYVPYSTDLDPGGDFYEDTSEMHGRRQRMPELGLQVSFRLPETEKLYGRVIGSNSSAVTGIDEESVLRDEALDEVTILWQKGGDRTTPMSAFIGIVNVGDTLDALESGVPEDRPSNYAICYGWFDAGEWGQYQPKLMRYKLGTGGANVGTTGEYCTLGYRVLVFPLWVEPGRNYHLSLDLKLDTGSPGTGVDPTAEWNEDGELAVTLTEHDYDNEHSPRYNGRTETAWVWKGPSDSLEYLKRYGVRYSGRDAQFLGLGMRVAPLSPLSYLPYGFDSWSLEAGGHRMTDRSTFDPADLFALGGVTSWGLDTTHTGATDDFLDFNRQGLSSSLAYASQGLGAPMSGRDGFGAGLERAWWGLSRGGLLRNVEALRGYRAVVVGSGTGLDGTALTLDTYSEPGGAFRMSLRDAPASYVTWTNEKTILQCLRWHQRSTVFSSFSLWDKARNFDPELANDSGRYFRRRFQLAGEALPNDEKLVEGENLLAYWPLSDGGGGRCDELVRGHDAYLAPLANAVGRDGTRGKQTYFLDGEMRALCLDLSENPVFQREFGTMLASGSGGFAIEFTCRMTEAVYALYEADDFSGSATELQARYTPILAEWSVRNEETGGFASAPRPLLRLSHRGSIPTTSATAYTRPVGFTLEAAIESDQEAPDLTQIVRHWDTAGGGTFYWDEDASWVGRTLTFQLGAHHDPDNPGSWLVYLAATPKDALKPSDGDPAAAEFAYYASASVDAKDAVRSVITIGGGFLPEGLGYLDLNARMIIDEVRVFAAAAPGQLPATSGDALTDRNGKILGGNSLPATELKIEDILQPVGPGLNEGNVIANTPYIRRSGETDFYSSDPSDSREAVKETMLLVAGDSRVVRDDETAARLQEEFYWVKDVREDATEGSTIVLMNPYQGGSRNSASIKAFRLVGYTSVGADQFGKALSLGRGRAFKAGDATSEDVTLTDDAFYNAAPLGENWAVRVYSPLSSSSALEITPRWVRGCSIPRRTPISGIESIGRTTLATAGSCLHIGDDRWRADAPRDNGRASLAFRTRRDPQDGLAFPLEQDLLLFRDVAHARLHASGAHGFEDGGLEQSRYWSFWVKLDSKRGFQTALWMGHENDNPMRLPGPNDDEFGMDHIVRFNDGAPELVVGVTTNAKSGFRPEKGLFVATGRSPIPINQWVHIRWELWQLNGWLEKPRLFVNGRTWNSTTNATDPLATGQQWFLPTALVESFSANKLVLALGAARDVHLAGEERNELIVGQLNGEGLRPDRFQGWMHSLDGQLAGLGIGTALTSELTIHPPFVPELHLSRTAAQTWETASYPGSTKILTARYAFFASLQEGIGHRPQSEVYDEAGDSRSEHGVLRSHPFITLRADLGREREPASFAAFGNRIFVTIGGRVWMYDDNTGIASPANLLPPTTRPRFDVQRVPLWRNAVQVQGDGLGNDPFDATSTDEQEKENYYGSSGNAYLILPLDDKLRWERDDGAGANNKRDIFAFTCWVRPDDVTGKIPIYSARSSQTSGGMFVEIEDGKCRLGWYDTKLKKQVFIETSKPVFFPGRWHQIVIRKLWPMPSVGNWEDSLWGGSTDEPLDCCIVRPAPIEDDVGDGTGDPVRETEWDLKANHGGTYYPDDTYNCISFTALDSSDTKAEFTSIGRVTTTDLRVDSGSTGPTGITITRQAGPAAPFHGDMYGMLIELWDATDTKSRLGRVTAVASTTSITVDLIDGEGALGANLSGNEASITPGVKMIKGDGFASSSDPDTTLYDADLFGSALAGNLLNGVSPFRGAFGSVGLVITKENHTTTPPLFSDDYLTTGAFSGTNEVKSGCSKFAGHIYSSTAPGHNEFNVNGENFMVLLSSQPNSNLSIELDSLSNLDALPPVWNYLVLVESLEGSRRVVTSFYDPATGDESVAGPVLVVRPSAEDSENPSGEVRYLLDQLPVSLDGRDVHRRVYITAAGGQTLHRVAEIPDNTSSSVSIFKSEGEINRSPIFDQARAVVPRCRVLGVSQQVLLYMNLWNQPDGVRYSAPFFPTNVPLENFLLFPSGKGAAVTGFADVDGRAIIFKRDDSIWKAIIVQGSSSVQEVSNGASCVSHQSVCAIAGRVYWRDPRGIYTMGADGEPIFVSRRMKTFFRDEYDKDHAELTSAAINRDRSQYICTSKRRDRRYADMRISVEYDSALSGAAIGTDPPAKHRLSPYRFPVLRSLGNAVEPFNGQQQLVGGSEQGFLYWMDRQDTDLLSVGPAGGFASAGPLLSLASKGIYRELFGVRSLGDYQDFELSGPRDTVVRWLDEDGEEDSAIALALFEIESVFGQSDPTEWLDTDMLVESERIPPIGGAISFGDTLANWDSKWLDLGLTKEKRGYWLDIYSVPQTSGRLRLKIFVDYNLDTPQIGGDASPIYLDMTQGFRAIHLEGHFRHVKVRLERDSLSTLDAVTDPGHLDNGFEVTHLVFRTEEKQLS